MHEISVCCAVAETVRRHASGRRVVAVNVEIGQLRQIVPETMTFCWGHVVDGTELQGARLVVDYIPMRVTCRSCGTSAEMTRPVLVCEGCGGADVTVLGGDEFAIVSIDVDDPTSSRPRR